MTIISKQIGDKIFYTGYIVGFFGLKRWFMLWIDGWPELPDLTFYKFNRSWTTDREGLEKYLKLKEDWRNN